MEGVIGVVAVLLIIAYIGVAIWVICKRQTIGESVATSAGFLCGGLIIIPVAEAVATFVVWAVVIAVVLVIIGAVLGG